MSPYDDDTVDELPAPPRKDIPEADRELLELAARALGARFEEVDGEGYGNLHFPDGSVVHAWNSLQFSGDTFDLAVDLGITFNPDASRTEQATAYRHDIGWIEERHEAHADARAAARHAVTRAAAKIGRIQT